jgi:transcriptional regulator GlxA family with amidase domain
MNHNLTQSQSNGIRRVPRPTHPWTAKLREDAVRRVVLAMHERLGEDLCLSEMAEVASMSVYHFARVFREQTGLPPATYLAALRLSEAKRLLLETSLSVADVCSKVGYNSIGTFTSRFTQVVGVSPGKFRAVHVKKRA